jgi:hypothetical protein
MWGMLGWIGVLGVHPEQQRSYAFQGAIATLFVTALVLVSFAVS